MVVGKDDLGLSLSLSCTTTNNNYISSDNHKTHHRLDFKMMMMMKNTNNTNTNTNTRQTTWFSNDAIPPLQLNLMITPSFSPSHRKTDTCRSIPMSSDGEEEDAGVSSPNSAVSTVSGKRSPGDYFAGTVEEADVDRSSSRGGISHNDDGGDNSRKKLRLSKDQSAIVEESFKEHSTLNPKQKQGLAKRLGLRPRQVEVWFQNRRARTKLKQTEVDCEFLKGCCEKLTEENRRLQKEVQELRALKLPPQFYKHMTPPTTLTTCPSCERVSGPSPSSSVSNHRPMPINLWPASHVRPFQVL